MSRRLDVVSGTSPSGPRDASPPSLDDKPREECGVVAVSGIGPSTLAAVRGSLMVAPGAGTEGR